MRNSNFNKNTWENVRKIREEIQSSEGDPTMIMEETWPLIVSKYEELKTSYDTYVLDVDRYCEKEISDDPIEAFLVYVSLGIYPPPELIIMIYRSLRIYLGSGGKVELEEVLFGLRNSKSNYAGRLKQNAVYGYFTDYVKDFKDISADNVSLPLIAEKFYEMLDREYPNVDKPGEIDTFLRNWRRKKEDN